MRRADDKYGNAFQKYLKDVKNKSKSITAKEIKSNPKKGTVTKLVYYESEKNSIDTIITSIMYEQSPSTSYQDILQQVRKMSKDKKTKIINEFTKIPEFPQDVMTHDGQSMSYSDKAPYREFGRLC